MADINNIIDGGRVQSARADSTLDKCARIVAGWRDWCSTRGQEPLPATASGLRRWCRERAAHVAVPTMRNELSALRTWHRNNGHPFPTPRRLAPMLTELTRLVPLARRPEARTLRFIARDMTEDFHAVRDRAILHCFATRETNVEDLVRLRVADVQLAPELVRLRGRGCAAYVDDAEIFDVEGARAMRAWFASRSIDSPYLFVDADGGSLTAADVLAMLRDRAVEAGRDLARPDVAMPTRAKRAWRTVAEVVAC